jgi:hypothetical protein
MQKPDTKITLAIMVALSLAAVPAVATDYHWKDSYPFGVWSSAANWTPSGGPPIGSGDKAYIGDALAGTYKSVLDITTTVGYLEIANPDSLDSAWLWTHGETLTVLGDTHLIETAANHAVQLFIDRGTGVDDFDTDRLDIDGGAELNMDGGIVEIDEQLDVDPSSHIVGYGLIKFSGSDARALSLAGTLRTDHATERLTLQVTGTGKLDLDGSSGGNSVIDVTYGTSVERIGIQLEEIVITRLSSLPIPNVHGVAIHVGEIRNRIDLGAEEKIAADDSNINHPLAA